MKLNWRNASPLLAMLFLAPMLGGCFESIKFSKDGTSPQLVECEKLAQKVDLPPIKAGMDKIALIARYRAALITANQHSADASACIAEVLKSSETSEKKK